MKVFDFDPAELRSRFQEQKWLHVRHGLSPEFLEYAQEHVAELVEQQDPLHGAAIKGAKDQFVFPFPADVDVRTDVHDVISRLTGMDGGRTVLSERHVKAYNADADPAPAAHKDRFASQISVGLTLHVGPDSHVVLWPGDERQVNEHLTTGLRDSLSAHEQPEARLDDSTAVLLHDRPGDVLVFEGSSTWHLRRRSASTTLVYLKFNDFGSDPLGEDPSTPERTARTQEALEGDRLDALVPDLSRAFDSLAQEQGWLEDRRTWAVNVWRDGARTSRAVPGSWAEVLSALQRDRHTGRSVGDLAGTGVAGLSGDELREAVRGLAERGALDLLPPG
jgi:hypothetical protein